MDTIINEDEVMVRSLSFLVQEQLYFNCLDDQIYDINDTGVLHSSPLKATFIITAKKTKSKYLAMTRFPVKFQCSITIQSMKVILLIHKKGPNGMVLISDYPVVSDLSIFEEGIDIEIAGRISDIIHDIRYYM